MLHQDCIAKLLDMEHLEVNDMEHSSNRIVLHVQNNPI